MVLDRRQMLAEYLITAGLAPPEAIARAAAVSGRTGQPVEAVLNQLGQLADDDLARAYAATAEMELWDPVAEPPKLDPKALPLGPEFLRRSRVLPIAFEDGQLLCAACDPFDEEMLAGLAFATGAQIALKVARPSDWRRCFDLWAFDASTAATEVSEELDERRVERDLALYEDQSVEGRAVQLVADAFSAAVTQGASDIHFEPRRNDLKIRLRVDGRLIDHATAPADLCAPVVSRVKVLSSLNVGERRLPQDGRASFVNAGRAIDVRVATSPTVFGESAVLRLLDRANAPQTLPSLGLAPEALEILQRAARTPHGLFLVTGPTGSGKTTTLYALLAAFDGSHKKILSVEDPVERHFEHVSQTQVSPGIGLTFATALRSFLRHDPDVILVGEIRDRETAEVAVQAAMTGHLVLASVHANTALGIAPRLNDMGIEPYQLAACLKGAMAQRLVRRLCAACKQLEPPSEALKAFASRTGADIPVRAFRAVGCPRCKGSGFAGRVAIAEGFWAEEGLLTRIGEGAGLEGLNHYGRSAGFLFMAADGVRRIAAGETTLDEVMAAADA